MKILAKYYFNTNGVAIAIIALAGGANDWAAYIGATHHTEHEVDAIEWTKKHGAKLSESMARALFEVDLIYRP